MGLVVFVMGWEWIVIGAVAIVLILWGPRLPELAKAFAKEKSVLKSKECTPVAKAETLDQVSTVVAPISVSSKTDN